MPIADGPSLALRANRLEGSFLGTDGRYHPKGSFTGVHGRYEEPEGAAARERQNQEGIDCRRARDTRAGPKGWPYLRCRVLGLPVNCSS